MNKYSATTGANLVETFQRDLDEANAKGKKPKDRKFLGAALGLDNRGEPRRNEFTLRSLIPAKSNRVFTTVLARFSGTGQDVELRIGHNTRYLVPVTITGPGAN